MQTLALGISGVNFCPGIRFWELNFARALGFWAIFDKISNSGTLKFMKTCPVIGFWGTFLPGLGFALATHPYLPLLGSHPPPPIRDKQEKIEDYHHLDCSYQIQIWVYQLIWRYIDLLS